MIDQQPANQCVAKYLTQMIVNYDQNMIPGNHHGCCLIMRGGV